MFIETTFIKTIEIIINILRKTIIQTTITINKAILIKNKTQI